MSGKTLTLAIDTGNFGPAMMALPSDRQRLFVIAVCHQGKRNYTEAAKSAGYEGDKDTLYVTAHRLSHDERVLAAIREEVGKRLDLAAPMAAEKIATLAEGSRDDAVALRASTAILDRAGFGAKTEHTVTVEHRHSVKMSPAELAQVAEAAAALGYDPNKFLPPAGPAIDAEFAEVSQDLADSERELREAGLI